MTKQGVGACSIFLALVAAASAQTPAGGEFRINTYTTSDQFLPEVAVEPDGDFVFVWPSRGQDGDMAGVFGQRYDRAGTPRGAEFQANTTVLDSQQGPAVAVSRTGSFVVVWQSIGPFPSLLDNLFGQLFDASGNRVGSEFHDWVSGLPRGGRGQGRQLHGGLGQRR